MLSSINTRFREESTNTLRRLQAARMLQAWARMCHVRATFLRVRFSAIVIQKLERGAEARRAALQLAEQKMYEYRMEYYNKCATLIERVVRGFLVRRHILDAHKRTAYIVAVIQRGDEVASLAREYGQTQEQKQMIETETKQADQLNKDASRLHHLVSTQARPGVLSPPGPTLVQAVGEMGPELFVRQALYK